MSLKCDNTGVIMKGIFNNPVVQKLKIHFNENLIINIFSSNIRLAAYHTIIDFKCEFKNQIKADN